jgi:preprotein translocase subunit SecA
MLKGILTKIVKDPSTKYLDSAKPLVEAINSLEPAMEALSDQELKAKTDLFRQRLDSGESLDDLLPEAFALVREASKRTTGMRHFDVQLIGGLALHRGNVTEMKTGEGKTLAATLAVYLNALEGAGVHVITVNDYLAKRDTQWMGPIYHLLGLSVGVIQHDSAFLLDPDYRAADERLENLRPVARREAYAADITYGTNNEFGFDYLRDNMVWDLSQCVQRELHYAIVDEIDNILIDEARTPLIISGQAEEPSAFYQEFAQKVKGLRRSSPESVEAEAPDGDFIIDERSRSVSLTERGVEKMESRLGIAYLYADKALELNCRNLSLDALGALRGQDQLLDEVQLRKVSLGVTIQNEDLPAEAVVSELLEESGVSVEAIESASQRQVRVRLRSLNALDATVEALSGSSQAESLELDGASRLLLIARDVDERKGQIEEFLAEHGVETTKSTTRSNRYYEAIPYLENALKAQVLFKLDRDYIVKDGEVIIVDEFTGRLMHGRRYSEGLHQAIEAKEGVRIQRESMTLATITFQNYFRMYEKLAGMTGTALTEKEEFQKIYNLDVVAIPTHKPMIRADHPDLVYKTESAKFRAVVEEIEELHEQGQPILVGTISVERSEMLSNMLRRRGIAHQVLNAKQHEREATVIAQAGRLNAVTIATNMAGRGVDILLGGNPEGLARDALRKSGEDILELSPQEWADALDSAKATCAEGREQVLDLGGLHTIGTERHEARRIDNQLRGRAGRQGDPGSSRFYTSLEDDLMRRFGGSTISNLMDRVGLDEDVPIESGLISKSIENAQTKVEGHNFDIRKHVLEYDDVINKQRQVIYDQRREVLSQSDLKPIVMDMLHEQLRELISTYVSSMEDEPDFLGLQAGLRSLLPLPPEFSPARWEDQSALEIESDLSDLMESLYEQKEQELGSPVMHQLERVLMLRAVDSLWMRHLTALDNLRQGVGLRAYGQRNPLIEYKTESYDMFQELNTAIRRKVANEVFRVTIAQEAPQPTRRVFTSAKDQAPSRPAASRQERVGRNDPCPCGSGKKYKQCCMKKGSAASGEPAAASTKPRGKKKTKKKKRSKK